MTGASEGTKLFKHRILIANDDGIDAEGLALLERVARTLTDDVWVVAPDEERSGISHAISLTVPLRYRRLGEKRFAVKGTPADCVLLALGTLMKDSPPTMVLSGINHGENLADDMTYSGTAGVAIEAAIWGIPAIAISQVRVLGKVPNFSVAEKFCRPIVEKLMTARWEPGVIMNVNFPRIDAQEVTGVRVVTAGKRRSRAFHPMEGIDGRNIPLYWIKVNYDAGPAARDTDLEAIQDKAISITAMQVDMTSHAANAELKALFSEQAVEAILAEKS